MAALLAALVVGMVVAIATGPAVAQSPGVAPTAAASERTEPIIGGDPRSDGQGPGIVGSPLGVLAGVIGLGLITAGVTIVVVRFRGEPAPRADSTDGDEGDGPG